MNRDNRSILIFAALLGGAVLLFVYSLLTVRTFQGGGYPEYSSYRTDPLGARALFESFARIPGMQTVRHEQQYDAIKGGKGDAFWILALAEGVIERRDIVELEKFMAQGGNVLMAFDGRSSEPFFLKEARMKKEEKTAEGEVEGEKEGEEGEGENLTATTEGESAKPEKKDRKAKKDLWKEQWTLLPRSLGFSIHYAAAAKGDASLVGASREDLPEHLPWHSSMRFRDLKEGWAPVYEMEGDPVVIQRAFGAGRLVLLSDSYLFSNEALRRDRQAAFISWAVGENRRRIIFDEAHLGLIDSPTIMTMIRHYRLTGFIVAVLAALVLFIWRNMTSLAPKKEEDFEVLSAGVIGAGAGLAALFRRSIPKEALLKQCWQTWLRSYPNALMPEDPIRKKVESLVASFGVRGKSRKSIAEAYRDVAEALKERKIHRGT